MQPCLLPLAQENLIPTLSYDPLLLIDEEFPFPPEAESKRIGLENQIKEPLPIASPPGLFEEPDRGNDDECSSQYTEARSRCSSPCPSLSTSLESCSDSDGCEEGTKSSSNRKDVQSQAPNPHCGRCSVSYVATTGTQAQGSRSATEGDNRRDDCSPELTLDVEMRFKKRDEEISYACPYRKRYPLACNVRDYAECAGESFRDLKHVMDHLGRRHLKLTRDWPTKEVSKSARGSIYPSGEALWMTTETFDSIKVHGEDSSNPRQKWEYIWRGIFGPTEPIIDPNFEAPIEAEEIVSEFQKGIHEFDLKIRREVGDLAFNPTTSTSLASVGAQVTELWVRYLNSALEKCETKVRGSPSLRLTLPRRAMTDIVSHRPTESAFTMPSPGQPTRAKTMDCLRTVPPSLHMNHPRLETLLSGLPNRLTSPRAYLEHFEAAPTPTLAGSSTILDEDFQRESTAAFPDDSIAKYDSMRVLQELDDSDMSDTCTHSPGEEQDEDSEYAEEDALDEITSRISGLFLSVLSKSPADSLIQTVQLAVDSFVNELFNDVQFMDCPQDAESVPDSNSRANDSSEQPPASDGSTTGFNGTGANGSRSGPAENPKGDGNEQGENPPGADNAVNPNWCPNGLYYCPYHIRNPSRFNREHFLSCATKKWASLSLLKRHIKSKHRREDEVKFACTRCQEKFPTLKALEKHNVDTREAACQVASTAGATRTNDDNPEDGLSADGLKGLADRTSLGKVDCWQSLWRLLFPGDKYIPRCVPPKESSSLTYSFLQSQSSLAEIIRESVREYLPEETAAALVGQIYSLLTQAVSNDMRAHSGSTPRVTSARPHNATLLSPSSGSRGRSSAPATKKRKAGHVDVGFPGSKAPEIPASVASMAHQPLAPASDPDMQDWTMLGASRLADPVIASPESQYSMSQPAFHGTPGYAPTMGVMMQSPQFQIVHPTTAGPYAMSSPQQGFNPNHSGQHHMFSGMDRNSNVQAPMGMNFCPQDANPWPCPVHFVRP